MSLEELRIFLATGRIGEPGPIPLASVLRSSRALATILVVRARIENESSPNASRVDVAARLASALEEGGAVSFSSAYRGLSASDRATLGTWLGSELAAWSSLENESDPALFGEALLDLGRRALQGRDPATAVAVFSWLQERGVDPAWQVPQGLTQIARSELGAITGESSFGNRLEFLGRNFLGQAADPTTIGAMAAGSFVFSTLRLGALARLSASPTANWLTRGAGARVVASAAAFGPELATFWGTERLLRQATRPESQRWDGATLRREWGSLALTLGLLKIGGASSRAIFQRWQGVEAGAATAARVPAFTRVSGLFLEQGGMLASLGLAQELEARWELRPRSNSAHPALDAFATLLNLNVGGRFASGLLGPAYAQRLSAVEASLRASEVLPQASSHSSSISGLFQTFLPRPAFAAATGTPGLLASGPRPGDFLADGLILMSQNLGGETVSSGKPETILEPSTREIPSDPPTADLPREVWRQIEPLVLGLRASVDDTALERLFQQVHFSPELLRETALFSPEAYARRVLLREGEGDKSFEVLMLGWEDGQGTVPHDHGGSSGFDKILEGEGVEIPFLLGQDGSLLPQPSHRLPTGAVSEIPKDVIHIVANRQGGGRRLISLHVYRPIMDSSRIRRFADPGILEEPKEE